MSTLTEVDRAGDATPTARPRAVPTAVLVLAGIATAVGIVLRWWPRPVLWLDEAQSVAFARLPVTDIAHALREDGAPPLYYVLLHGWMRLFGDGDAALRALSAAISTVTIGLLAVVVRRRWGLAAAVAATVLLATSPFAIRYATYVRMYSLVMFEVVLGIALVGRALERPRLGRLVAVTVLAGAALYTHYWAMYLLVTVGAVLLATSLGADGPTRRARRRTGIAVLAGFVLWLPWVPTFLFQAGHTATPWAPDPTAAATLEVFAPTVEGPSVVGILLGIMLAATFLVGLRSRTAGGGAITIPGIGVVGGVTACVAVMGAIASASAVSSRYLSVAVPLVLLTAAVGAISLPIRRRRGLAGVLVVGAIGVAGLYLGSHEARTERTTADDIALAILAEARPGDVVVTCPDQLSPALHRLLERGDLPLDERSYPPGSTPARVNWIDYADRARSALPILTARALVAEHPGQTIWLVVSTTYPPTQAACDGLLRALQRSAVTGRLVSADPHDLVEHGALWRFDPGRTPPTGS